MKGRSDPTFDDGALRSPFAIPLYRSGWIAALASGFGTLIQGVGAAWLMTSLSGSPDTVALVQSAMTLPLMLLSLWAGALADNFDRRAVMLAAQGLMLVASLFLALVTWSGHIAPWSLLLFTFVIGCGMATNAPASQAMVGDIVDRPLLPSAVALNSMSYNVARTMGPAIGGAIVAAAGSAAAFGVNACSYLGLIVVLARWRPPPCDRRLPRERISAAMAAGLRYAAMSPEIRLVCLRGGIFGVSVAAVSALMPVLARDVLGGTALTYGVLLGAFGIGSVGAGLLLSRLRSRYSPQAIVTIASLGTATSTAVVALGSDLALTIAALLLIGAGWVLALSVYNVAMQLSVPRWVVARALALYQMLAYGGMAIGAWAFGTLAGRYGIRTALLASATCHLLGAVVGWRLPLRSPEDQDLSTVDWKEPATSLPIGGRSGPIVVAIAYRIADGDMPAFLTLMDEQRRSRIRNGALDWALLRDLERPDLWTERYRLPTWHDYVRFDQRHTRLDERTWTGLLTLHLGKYAPRITRSIERQTRLLEAVPSVDGYPDDLATVP